MKGPYDHYKLNLLLPETLKVIRFGELAGPIDKARPYDEIYSLENVY